MQRPALVSSRKKAFRKSALLQTLNIGQVSSIQAKTALLKTNQDFRDLYDTLDTSALILLWYRHRFSSLGLYLQALLGGKAGFYLPRSPPRVVERSEVHFRAEFYLGECLFSVESQGNSTPRAGARSLPGFSLDWMTRGWDVQSIIQGWANQPVVISSYLWTKSTWLLICL